MKINKKSFVAQEKFANKEQKRARRRFKQKRETVLVRVQKRWRTPLLEQAKEKKKTLSKLHDEIYPVYFKHERVVIKN